ncbi:MAG TPA: hypothetical protein VK017_10435 [Sphingobacterium sp.]|jgi:hypothetical protein|nr:hypothetical protein [Sphingobacterium sp.]
MDNTEENNETTGEILNDLRGRSEELKKRHEATVAEIGRLNVAIQEAFDHDQHVDHSHGDDSKNGQADEVR